MKKYKVRLVFKYSDVVHVEANSEKEAIEKAMVDCDEQYESFVEAVVREDATANNFVNSPGG